MPLFYVYDYRLLSFALSLNLISSFSQLFNTYTLCLKCFIFFFFICLSILLASLDDVFCVVELVIEPIQHIVLRFSDNATLSTVFFLFFSFSIKRFQKAHFYSLYNHGASYPYLNIFFY